MENIVEGIRSRFFRTADENVADEDDLQRKQEKRNSRKDLKTHFEDERSGSRSRSRGRRTGSSGGRSSFGKGSRSLTSQPSYSSDDSTDIDAVVAAAVLTVFIAESPLSSSTETSPVSSHTRPWAPLPRIGEDPSHSRRHYDEDVNNPADSRALVPSTSMERRRPGTPQSNDSIALTPLPSRKDSKTSDSGSGRWDKQIVPSRSASYDNKEGSSRVSRSSSRAKEKEKERERERESRKHSESSFDQGKREKNNAKADAWLEEKLAFIENRYSKKNSLIQEWEDKRRGKAEMIFKEVEGRSMEKRMREFEKMKNKIQRVRKKADDKRAKLNGRKETDMAKVIRKADEIRRTGRIPSPTNCC